MSMVSCAMRCRFCSGRAASVRMLCRRSASLISTQRGSAMHIKVSANLALSKGLSACWSRLSWQMVLIRDTLQTMSTMELAKWL